LFVHSFLYKGSFYFEFYIFSMQNDNEINVESLVLNDSFRRWVLKNTPEDAAFWNEWIKDNADKADKIDLFLQAREIVLVMHSAQETITQEEVEKEISLLTQSLYTNKEISFTGRKSTAFSKYNLWFRAAAVALLLLLSGVIYWYLTGQSNQVEYIALIKQAPDPLTEEVNQTNKPKLINLADESTVILSPDSRISYPKKFDGEKREVYLQGEAFFEVTKNMEKPFLVHANGLVSKVLGTSFTIRAFAHDSEVKVMVKTGKVSVFPQNDQPQLQFKDRPELSGLILTPNQQVVFNRNDNRMIRTLVEDPAVISSLSIQQQHFSFHKTAIKEVFTLLEQTYGVNIVYNEDLLEGCELTGELGDEPLLEKMNLICKAIDGSYEMIDAQIVVQSKSCK
jgi:transmembrane sensor